MDFSQHFTYKRILASMVSPVIMMLSLSFYGMADGFFLSNFAGKEAFAATNFILPYLMMFNCMGFMFGTGGSALIGKMLGEKKNRDANEIFTNIMVFSLLTGVVLAALSIVFLRPAAVMQGAEGELLENSIRYGHIYLFGIPACLVGYEFQSLYSAAGKSRMGLYATSASGLTNIGLDALFIAVFKWGLTGAALATVLAQLVCGIIPFIYFSRENSSYLRVVRCRPRLRDMAKVCSNGISEMVTNISTSVVSILFNIQLLNYAGDDGIAAYGIMLYVNFIFTAVFWGYNTAMAPVISYNYGAQNHRELSSLLRKTFVVVGSFSIGMFAMGELLAAPLARLFASYDKELLAMTIHGFRIYACMFIFVGFSLFASSFFSALNNGKISALLAFSRVFIFQVPGILLLPFVFDLDGVWLTIVLSEILTVIMGLVLGIKYRTRYGY